MTFKTIERIRSTSNLLWHSAKASLDSVTYTPTGAVIFLTYRCTSHCSMCNIWRRPEEPERELDWIQWKPIIEKLADGGVRAIEFFGGDALLRKDLLLEMIQFCKQKGIFTTFPTNSLGLTEETAKALVEAGLDIIYISLDEVPEIGGSIRGVKRHFERVERGIEAIREARGDGAYPKIECITTVSSFNYRYLEQLLEFSSEHGVNTHHIRGLSEFPPDAIDASAINDVPPEPYFTSTDGSSHCFAEQDARELVEILRRIRRNAQRYGNMTINQETTEHLSVENLTSLTYPKQDCLYCTTQMIVSPYGEVMPCPYYNNLHLGNLNSEGVTDIWGNSSHRSFCTSQKDGKIPLCDYCSIKSVHMGLGTRLEREMWRVRDKLEHR